MTYAIKIDGAWVALVLYQPVTVNDISASWGTLMAWTDAEREEFGAYEVPEPAAPAAGKYEASRKLTGTTRPKWTATYADIPSPGPEPVPIEISPRQLLIGLAAKGWITPEEALAAATAGTPPAVIEGVFTSLPAEQQLAARITWARMTTVLRTDPLVPLLAATKGQSNADVDEFFRTYAAV